MADTDAARQVLEGLGSEPRHVGRDRFQAPPRPNVPEGAKPTPAQIKAQPIDKAQATRHRHH